MKFAVVGVGATGARVVRHLAATPGVTEVVAIDPDQDRMRAVVRGAGSPASIGSASFDPTLVDADVIVLCGPAGRHRLQAELAMENGADVVSVADSIDDVNALLELDQRAAEAGRRIVVGAGFSPGVSCLLARHGAAWFDHVDEVHVASTGTGGPACARQHHRAFAGGAVDYRDGAWVQRRGRSGRELCWFPDPIGGVDCYRAARPDVHLLVPAFPGISRVTVRLGGTRRDRLTARLPMLRAPHADGGPGALRVELRGRRGGGRDVVLLGAMDHPAGAAGTMAAVAALAVAEGTGRPGAWGLAELEDAVPLLRELERRGVAAAVFEGV